MIAIAPPPHVSGASSAQVPAAPMTGIAIAQNAKTMTGTGQPVKSGQVLQANAFVAQPKVKQKIRMPTLKGYSWKSDSAGWTLRKRVNGKLVYVGHLSRSAYDRLKRKHPTPLALKQAIQAWVGEQKNG